MHKPQDFQGISGWVMNREYKGAAFEAGRILMRVLSFGKGMILERRHESLLRHVWPFLFCAAAHRVSVTTARLPSFSLEGGVTNTNLVARLVDCWNTGKLEDIDDMLSSDFIRHEPEMGSRTTGREDYKQTVSRYRSTLSDFHTEATDTIEQGNKLVFRFKTTGKRDNSPMVFEGVNILRIEGSKVVEDWVYFDATAVKRRLARAQTA
jgi:ketosteroid isomerase-like protein